MRILKALIAMFEVLMGIICVAVSLLLIGVIAVQCPADWIGYCAGMIFVFAMSLFFIKIMAFFRD